MRHIVIEGVDNSGKSTLAARLASRLDLPVQGSEGPPHYPGEMNERIARYHSLPTQHIFDRHPVVSQAIYCTLRTGLDPMGMDPALVKQFYASQHLFIYCDPAGRGMSGHQYHEGVDTPEHLAQVNENYAQLLTLYRAWAIAHAHLIYRIGDDPQFIYDTTYQWSTQNESWLKD